MVYGVPLREILKVLSAIRCPCTLMLRELGLLIAKSTTAPLRFYVPTMVSPLTLVLATKAGTVFDYLSAGHDKLSDAK